MNQEFRIDIKKELNTQDECYTEHPFYVVYEKIKYTCANGYTDDWVWVDEDGGEYSQEDLNVYLMEELDFEETDLDNLDFDVDELQIGTNDFFRKWYYQTIPRFNQGFFTRKAAEEYIEYNGHNLIRPYIYVKGLFRNYEMIEVRNLLKK